MPKILILEDDAERIEVFQKEIFPRNFELTFATTYDEAVNALQSYNFDVLFLDRDLGLGTETGEDVAKWIAENEIGSPLIIIHSWNIPGADAIQNILSNYETYKAPFYGLIFRNIIKEIYKKYTWI